MRIDIAPGLAIDAAEIDISFIQAGGPGGQNVNKVATAAQLRFDARASPNLPEDVRARLLSLAGTRLTRDGVIVITARAHRSQDRNRADAIARLVDLIAAAATRRKRRVPTRPSAGAKARRVDAKTQRAATKRNRARPEI